MSGPGSGVVLVLVAGIAVPERDRALVGHRDVRGIELERARSHGGERLLDAAPARELVEGHPGGRRQLDLVGVAPGQGSRRAHPGVVVDLATVDLHPPRLRGRDEEPGEEALGGDGRGAPVRVGQHALRLDPEPGLLLRLPHGGGAGRALLVSGLDPVPVLGIHTPAREDPHAAHELELRVAPQHQGLEPIGSVADQDHGGSGDRGGRRPVALRPVEETILVAFFVRHRAELITASRAWDEIGL